jgi:murein DD-endopeptidase MepM/ murein hydrolase activator NlpD
MTRFRIFFLIFLAFLIFLFTKDYFLPFAMPVKTGYKIRSDAYGDGTFAAERRNGRRHDGIDILSEMRAPVYASKSGWAKAYRIPRGYGNLVIINHMGGWQTRYGHLYKIAIKKSQWVRRGDIIGFVGKTGNANTRGIAPHLHFEIRYKGKPVDPEKELLK